MYTYIYIYVYVYIYIGTIYYTSIPLLRRSLKKTKYYERINSYM